MMVRELETPNMVFGLHRIAQRLRSALNTQELCRALADAVADELALPDVVVYRRCAKNDRYAQIAAAGGKAGVGGSVLAPLTIVSAEGIVGNAAMSTRPIRVDCTQHDARYIVDDQSRLAELSVPICYDGEALGVLDAEHGSAGFFQPLHEVSFMLAAELAAPRLADLMARERQRGTLSVSAENRPAERHTMPTPLRDRQHQMLDAAEFGVAIERALLHVAAPQTLLKSRLCTCALLSLAPSANPVLRIRQLLTETVDSLIAQPRTTMLGRILKCAYFEAPDSRALLASRLHIGESTLRRRLKLARDTLIATLWAEELAARGTNSSAPGVMAPEMSGS